MNPSVGTPHCRSCGHATLDSILSLGRTPLANALLDGDVPPQGEPTYPLELVLCPACSLVQITESVPPEILFREYPYRSSFSETMLRHAETLADRIIKARGLGPGSLAAEIGSNDGYLLQYYLRAGVPVLGIEPAENIARLAESEKGVRSIAEFFGETTARNLAARGEKADVLHANNVLAHVPDINGVVEGIRLFLKPEGVAIIETPYVKELLDKCEFDTIYHEHLYYYSLTALTALLGRHGLAIHDVERLPIHGGSLRVFVGHTGHVPTGAAVTALLEEEAAWGVSRLSEYSGFARRIESLKTDLLALLTDLKSRGKRLAAYGASAKGSTLLNTFGIGRNFLEYVVDLSTAKQGRFTPGSHLLIHPPARLMDDLPDYVLLLTWNFADEILAQQAAYRAKGGQFIIPIPTLRVV